MQKLPTTLRDNVRLLGDLLGEVLKKNEGIELFQKLEDIRALSKSLATDDSASYQPLIDLLSELGDEDILPITRAFNQFLNLANIADQQYSVSAEAQESDKLKGLIDELLLANDKSVIKAAINDLQIELVLTAHPTEVSRRTLIQKYDAVAKTLKDLQRCDLLDYQQDKLQGRLYRLIEEIWTTDEIRNQRPTAVDEAKWGFAVIENSLWQAIPDIVRHIDRVGKEQLGEGLALDAKPFVFQSWMGGDRDGNPNVTHQVTEEVVLLGRWKAADLYFKDVESLIGDLSMFEASDELRSHLKDANSTTPYREFLRVLRDRLKRTMAWTHARLNKEVGY